MIFKRHGSCFIVYKYNNTTYKSCILNLDLSVKPCSSSKNSLRTTAPID